MARFARLLVAAALTLAVAVTFVIAATATSLAADLCITQGGTTVFAGRKFSLPGKDKCKPITGFNQFAICSGVACTVADGTFVRVHYTCSDDQAVLFQSFYYGFPLPLPSSNAGNATYSAIDNGTPGGFSSPPGTYQLAPCATPLLSVP
jgi:hypothetical protein